MLPAETLESQQNCPKCCPKLPTWATLEITGTERNRKEPSGTGDHHQPTTKGTAMPDKDYLTVEEVAHTTGFSDRYIRNHIAAGNLAALKIGRHYRVRRDDIPGFMELLADLSAA